MLESLLQTPSSTSFSPLAVGRADRGETTKNLGRTQLLGEGMGIFTGIVTWREENLTKVLAG